MNFVKLNEIEYNQNKKLVSDNLEKFVITLGSKGAMFLNEVFGSNKPQETIDVSGAGDTFTSELKNPELLQKCKEGNAESCKIVKYKIDKMVKSSYQFYGALEWAKHVVKDLQKTVRGVPESKHHEVEIARIKKLYSNTYNSSAIKKTKSKYSAV